ncbi:MAG: hypothetical protein AAGA86_14545, partial [Bacteroidota bacterium]
FSKKTLIHHLFWPFGGVLQKKKKHDSGNGVPVLSRIPVIKWLFSQRKREDTKQRLTILIKPTVIY